MKDVIGIIGGLGSYAGVGLLNNLLHATGRVKDQDFIEVILHSNPNVPDRNEAILNNDDSPVKELIRSAKMLESCGANKILIACISAHNFYKAVQNSLKTAKIIDIVEETVSYIRIEHPTVKNIGIVCSRGTVKAQIWQKAFQNMDVSLKFLSDQEQTELFDHTIFGENSIKAGCSNSKNQSKIKQIVDILRNNGADIVLGACSELQLVLPSDPAINYYDVFEMICHKVAIDYYENIQNQY